MSRPGWKPTVRLVFGVSQTVVTAITPGKVGEAQSVGSAGEAKLAAREAVAKVSKIHGFGI
jgi:hypothetical protein